MKTKLIGLGICLMLLTTIFAAAQPLNTTLQSLAPKTQKPSSTMVDVPVWEVGDRWTYQINDISIDYTTETQSILLTGSISALPLEVTDITDDLYTLGFTTTMNAHGYVYSDQGDGPVNVSINIADLAIQGTVQVEKSSLGIKDISLSFDNQKITFDIIDQPFITLPSWLHLISAKFTSTMDVTCDISVSLLSFPLNTGMYWDLVATNFTVNGQLESFLFKVLSFINNFAKLFGKELLPAEIAALLPVIHFNDALTQFLGTNVFPIPGFAGVFYCPATESVTVPAGTYEAFNITLLGGIGQCYYASAAGNVIQLSGNFSGLIPFIKNLDLVLMDTNYS